MGIVTHLDECHGWAARAAAAYLTRALTLGHLQPGGPPTAFDRAVDLDLYHLADALTIA